jgi:hypothetical protein
MGIPNTIRMRLIAATWDVPSQQRPAVAVEIDGRSLASIVSAASAGAACGEPPSPAEVLWPDRELWLGYPLDADDDYDPQGRAPVLVCACGLFGCGGVGARIKVEDGEVRWFDFIDAPTLEPVEVGAFRFDEAAYRAEIESVVSVWRRDWGGR